MLYISDCWVLLYSRLAEASLGLPRSSLVRGGGEGVGEALERRGPRGGVARQV